VFNTILPIVAAVVIAFLASFTAAAQAPGVVSVLYAGSLVTQMEGPIKQTLRSQGIDFQGEPGGSKALAHLIDSGVKSPDIFISVNPALVRGLGAKVSSATTFASTTLGIGWSDKSRYASLFNGVAAGKMRMLDALSTQGLRIGRTDPSLDPKGAYTIEAMKMLAGDAGEQRILGDDRNSAQVFPEENLLTRTELGDVDAGFFYRTEAIARGLHFLRLPGKASLSDKITYTFAVMKAAPHPAQAQAFARFILSGAGKPILQKAGIDYFSSPKTIEP
jgi:molybdate/tungstate transport system substrate-binding protein